MKAVVTGVGGFIGSHIATKLITLGHVVIGVDDLSAGYVINIPEGVQFFQKDVCDIMLYSEILKGVDVIFHNAASKKNVCMRDPSRDLEVNGIGTLRLLQAAVKHNVGKFVHASTGSVYGEVSGTISENTARRPCSYYGISKLAGESYVNLFHTIYGLNTTILRYFHVYGDRQESRQETGGVVAIFADKIQKGEDIIIHGDGTQKRVFTYVDDIVDANIQSWQNSLATGKVYNCASLYQMDINSLAILLMNKYARKVNVIYKDPLVGDITNFNVDSTKIQYDLCVTFRPIDSIL